MYKILRSHIAGALEKHRLGHLLPGWLVALLIGAVIGNTILKPSLHFLPLALVFILLLIGLILTLLLVRSMRQVRALSIRDGLTGLYNRCLFDEVVQLEFARCRRHGVWLGLMLLDIDFFKKYNSHHGRRQGDQVLKRVTASIRTVLKRESDVLFRVGGEKFAVLVELGRPADLGPMAQRLNEAVRALDLPHVQSPHGRVTVSIGTTLIDPAHWFEVETIYKTADQALYAAKASGRDKAVFRESF